jgi:hypothetical protein
MEIPELEGVANCDIARLNIGWNPIGYIKYFLSGFINFEGD